MPGVNPLPPERLIGRLRSGALEAPSKGADGNRDSRRSPPYKWADSAAFVGASLDWAFDARDHRRQPPLWARSLFVADKQNLVTRRGGAVRNALKLYRFYKAFDVACLKHSDDLSVGNRSALENKLSG